MTTLVRCVSWEGDISSYFFETREEADQFRDDVHEHSEDFHTEVIDGVISTRKQALSDLLGV